MSATTTASATAPGHRMRVEMGQQPDRVRAAFEGVLARSDELGRLVGAARQVLLLGRGSSRSAATYAVEAFRALADVPAANVSPAQVAWSASGDLRGALVVAVSQSGESTEMIAAARAVTDRGADLVVVTNSERSSLAQLVPDELRVGFEAGEELAVPATKTFTTSLAALLGIAASGRPQLVREAATAVPDLMAQVLDGLVEVDADVSNAADFMCAGEGYALSVGEESAIKLRETQSRPVASLETSELLHGSINSVHRGTALFLAAADELGEHLSEQAAREASARGAWTCTVSSAERTGADRHVRLPAVPAHWAPFLAILPLQRIAHDAALARGLDPDQPAGLTKVTRIEELGS